MKAVLEESFCREVIDLLKRLKSEEAKHAIRRLKDAVKERRTSEFYQEAARCHHLLREGELEVDDHATVSHGDEDGAYVQAWLWVTGDEMRQVRKELQAKQAEPTAKGV